MAVWGSYNEVWKYISDNVIDDDFDDLKNLFRMENGTGLTAKENHKCKTVYHLREYLEKKGIISKSNIDKLIESFERCNLIKLADMVRDFNKLQQEQKSKLDKLDNDLSESNDKFDLHTQLITALEQDFTDDEFESLRSTVQPIRHEKKYTEEPKNIHALLDMLEKVGVMQIGKYDELHTLLKKAGMPGKSGFIKPYENRIKEIKMTTGLKRKSGEVSSTVSENKKPKSDDGLVVADCHRHNVHVCYERSRSKPGLVLIINQFTKDRKGTEKDEEDIRECFENLNFEVMIGHDLSKEDAEKMIDVAKEKLKLKIYDSFVMFILSHGDEHGIKTVLDDCTEEDERLKMDDIQEKMNGKNLQEMSGRPKIFLVQACRGGKYMEGNLETDDQVHSTGDKNLQTDNISGNQRQIIPCEADILIAYSQTKQYLSMRHTLDGSWFIQHFLEVLDRNKHCHVLDILTIVNSDIADKKTVKQFKQMPVFVSSLRKFFYFADLNH